MQFKRTDDFVNRHMVYDDKHLYLGCVISGSFASTAWVELEPYRTMTGRVEVCWSDDNMVASMDRNHLNRIKTVDELDTIVAAGHYTLTEEFRDWLSGEDSVVINSFACVRRHERV